MPGCRRCRLTACSAVAGFPPPHMQNINLPLTGDDAAIRKYAADVEALKKQIGMPDVEEVRRGGSRAGCGTLGHGRNAAVVSSKAWEEEQEG